MATTLETPRLVLRPLALSDAPAIQKYFNNWNIIQNLSTVVPWPYPDNGAETFIASQLPHMEAGEIHLWALALKDASGEAIGIIEYRMKTNAKGNRGFWLAEPYWGQGLMTEAVNAVNTFVFQTLGVESFVVCNAESNAASRRIKQKTGAQFLGHVDIAHHSGTVRSEQWRVTPK